MQTVSKLDSRLARKSLIRLVEFGVVGDLLSSCTTPDEAAASIASEHGSQSGSVSGRYRHKSHRFVFWNLDDGSSVT